MCVYFRVIQLLDVKILTQKKKKKKLWLPQINGKFQINGGQPTENFLKAFRMAASGDV